MTAGEQLKEEIMIQISGDTVIYELVRDYPEAKRVLARHGLMCTNCQGAVSETLRHAAQNHGIPLERLIEDLKAQLHMN